MPGTIHTKLLQHWRGWINHAIVTIKSCYMGDTCQTQCVERISLVCIDTSYKIQKLHDFHMTADQSVQGVLVWLRSSHKDTGRNPLDAAPW